jgi:hypothetical protein
MGRWPFLSAYILFEVFRFKNILNAMDNVSRARNGHLKWKELAVFSGCVLLKCSIL